jgi:hypothetical protein
VERGAKLAPVDPEPDEQSANLPEPDVAFRALDRALCSTTFARTLGSYAFPPDRAASAIQCFAVTGAMVGTR